LPWQTFSNNSQVREAAVDLVSKLRAIVRLRIGRGEPITYVRRVFEYLPGGTVVPHVFSDPLTAEGHARASVAVADSTGKVPPLEGWGPLIELGRHDADVARGRDGSDRRGSLAGDRPCALPRVHRGKARGWLGRSRPRAAYWAVLAALDVGGMMA
jgi:hypothetical protein